MHPECAMRYIKYVNKIAYTETTRFENVNPPYLIKESYFLSILHASEEYTLLY